MQNTSDNAPANIPANDPKHALQTALSQFTGTAQYWRVARQFVITDGVKFLAESLQCFWLIDAAVRLQMV